MILLPHFSCNRPLAPARILFFVTQSLGSVTLSKSPMTEEIVGKKRAPMTVLATAVADTLRRTPILLLPFRPWRRGGATFAGNSPASPCSGCWFAGSPPATGRTASSPSATACNWFSNSPGFRSSSSLINSNCKFKNSSCSSCA